MAESEESKSKIRKAGEEIAKESNPVTFWQKIRGAPVIEQIFRVIDRFL